MNIKFLSAGAGLFGLGALFGWALTADHYDNKLKHHEERLDILEERVKVLRQRANNTLDEHMKNNALYGDRILELEGMLKGAGVDFVPTFEVPESNSEISPAGESEETIDEEAYEETRSNLQRIIDQYVPTDEDAGVEKMVEAAAKMEADRTIPPYVISRDRFALDEEDGQYFDKITLTYYPRDRMLLDDEEEPIEDVPGTVGWKNLRQFGGESGDPDIVYIRNHRLSTDFEVVREEEGELPLHVKYGMGREEFAANKAAGIIKLRPEDRG